jgi:glycogen debranching enzyme
LDYFNLRRDHNFVAEVYPKLIAYDDWLLRRRTDSAGRFILWHGDESGWDDATRHYPVPALPLDVHVHQLLHRMALLSLGGAGMPKELKSREHMLAVVERSRRFDASLESFWHAGDSWHYDLVHLPEGSFLNPARHPHMLNDVPYRNQIAASGLFALLWSSEEHVVDSCIRALNNPRVFGSDFPIPTLAICDPDYRPHGWGWNGPAWLQVNYFVLTGLLQNGRTDEALKLWEKTRRLIIREGRPYSFELYDPESGTGMGCPDYSWQAMINHLIIRHFAGVDSHFMLNPCLPPGMQRLSVSNLPGIIRSCGIARSSQGYVLRVEYTKPLVPVLKLQHLGVVSAVRANGLQFESDGGQTWMPDYGLDLPDDHELSAEDQARATAAIRANSNTHWEINIECA